MESEGPKIRWKGSETFRHDLFRLKPKDLMRNLSFKVGHVNIEKIPHTHFFHTFDSQGRAQTYSTPTGGHFHEIKWSVDPDSGEFKAECGPPLHHVFKKRAGAQKRFLSAVKWDDHDKDRTVIDDHIHDIEYAWSEELSAETIRQRRTAGQALTAAQAEQREKAKTIGMESELD